MGSNPLPAPWPLKFLKTFSTSGKQGDDSLIPDSRPEVPRSFGTNSFRRYKLKGNVPKLRCVTVPRATVVALALAIVVLHWAAPCSAQSRELSRSDIATGRKIIAIEATRILDDSLKRKGLDANSFTETIRFILMADPDLLVLRVAADPAPALGENVFRL